MKLNDSKLKMDTRVYTDHKTNLTDTLTDYPKDRALPYFLNLCALKYADKIALKFHQSSLTYKNLYERSNKLARLLIDNQIKTGDIIGLAVDRSPEMIICLLAILKVRRSLCSA